MEIRIDKSYPNYSQRNNQINPFDTCMPTAAVASLTYGDFDLTKIKERQFYQPEDDLTFFLNHNEDVLAYYKEHFPDSFVAGVPPNEFHSVVAYGINKWVGCDVDTFVEVGVSLHDLLDHIYSGRPAFASGQFDYYSNKEKKVIQIGHVVSFVGFKTLQTFFYKRTVDIKKVTSIIINDPLGDFHTNYLNSSGRGIEMTVIEFNTKIKPVGLQMKSVHLLKAYKDFV